MTRTAVITGAGSGIGAATALRLAENGYHVALLDRDEGPAGEIAARITGAGGQATVRVVDVSDPDQVGAAFSALPFTTLDALVNNAGIREIRGFDELTTQEWYRVIDVNLHGTFHCVKAAAGMLRAAQGSVVNVSSVAGLMGVPGRVAYTASKHAVIGLTKALAAEFGPDNVRVNAVCPGVIETPLTESYFGDENIVRGLRSVHTLGRWGTPDEIASVIEFLCGSQAAFCTGSVFTADGGFTSSKTF
ncbi:MAG TPA: SDR family NAD(P)-dependent oxidoreductase [Pseudonocardia sp.]|jgi:NAD(P)-dependent dehydrogenase (short-subunit alcohol dehydrogenase family)|nr:SDR family NAD(P)-dependent oxidoreductase [Pseudonocardia sp.]